MLELKNVSKIYYSKDNATNGFTKVSLTLYDKEFIVITGESGSGKSTLLNVISGLDSYEEGEMYINGEETSGYTEKDFENYRKKYIGNIFQNFNLINSYTVYQNVELVLLINGYKRKEIKKNILDVLKKVDLLKYKNTKVSKLSGGQKQRVAIARVLVKDTPIIVADEPTGNLDSKTADNIINLLKEIAKDKLIIIVTHNYEQVEKYATRKITMHDGKIIEDKNLIKREIKNELIQEVNQNDNKKQRLSFINKIKLGIRNTFNIKIKFLLLLTVYLFINLAVIGMYTSLKKAQYEETNTGRNYNFRETSDKRIIIQKSDLSELTIDDYNKIKSLNNIDYVMEDDLFLDISLPMKIENTGTNVSINSLDKLDEEVSIGKLPENKNEIIMLINENRYYLSQSPEDLIGKTTQIMDENGTIITDEKLVIVGIVYSKDTNNYEYNNKIYLNNSILENIRKNINKSYSNCEIDFNNKVLKPVPYNNQYKIITNANVPFGKAYVPESMNYMTKKYNAINYSMDINIDNIYYKDSINVKIAKTYNKNNIKRLLGITNFDEYNGAIFVNPEQYDRMFEKGNYQSSVFIKDEKIVRNTIKELQELGLKPLYIKDTLVDELGQIRIFINIFKVTVSIVIIVVLFFISYFIIKIIMKSRNIYFSTIRILGATRNNANNLLTIELWNVLNISYIIFLISLILTKKNILNISYLQSMISYLKVSDLFVLYLLLLIISLLISERYARKLFKKSAMNTYREEEV